MIVGAVAAQRPSGRHCRRGTLDWLYRGKRRQDIPYDGGSAPSELRNRRDKLKSGDLTLYPGRFPAHHPRFPPSEQAAIFMTSCALRQPANLAPDPDIIGPDVVAVAEAILARDTP